MSYTTPCPRGHTMYHGLPARPYHKAFHAQQAIPYAMPARWHIPCHTIYHATHAIYHAMPARLYHISCHALPGHSMPCQTIPYTMLCPPGHTICHVCQTISYTMSCPPGHTIYHGVPARRYYIAFHAHQAIPYMPYHIPCHACHIPTHAHQAIPRHALPGHAMPRQTIPYTMLCPPGHTICHAMSTKPFHMPFLPGYTIYHVRHHQAIPYTIPYLFPRHACQAIPYTTMILLPTLGNSLYLFNSLAYPMVSFWDWEKKWSKLGKYRPFLDWE